jgi:mono/diheme cytochrome c family protein
MPRDFSSPLLSLICLAAIAFSCACQADEPAPEENDPTGGDPALSVLPANEQDLTGDPDAGREFLLYGDFVGSGLPYEAGKMIFGMFGNDDLGREGKSEGIPHSFNVFTTPNGVEVIGGLTCYSCHSAMLDGERVFGVGNHASDFTRDSAESLDLADRLVKIRYPAGSPEREAYEVFERGARAVAPHSILPFRGPNAAVMLEVAAIAHRNPEDLSWSDEPLHDVGETVIGIDVPPLWHVKKKHALYYNGMGRGDFSRLIQQISVVALFGKEQYEASRPGFKNLLAYLNTLEPPAWKGEVDQDIASRGEEVFQSNCARCHGVYGEDEAYPNLLVSVDEVGTDPLYAEFFTDEGNYTGKERDWYGKSPYSQGSSIETKMAYIAPPLDGIWATAPYLHNGSVPTLRALLDSSTRPTYWRRDFDALEYDAEDLGWRHEALDVPPGEEDKDTYNTTLEGYSNQGHIYGDALSEKERQELLEYMKTL